MHKDIQAALADANEYERRSPEFEIIISLTYSRSSAVIECHNPTAASTDPEISIEVYHVGEQMAVAHLRSVGETAQNAVYVGGVWDVITPLERFVDRDYARMDMDSDFPAGHLLLGI